jgi:hypothetical protein
VSSMPRCAGSKAGTYERCARRSRACCSSVRCPSCERHVTGKEQGSYETRLEEDSYNRIRYALLSCPECWTPFLVRQDGSEEYEPHSNHTYTKWDFPTVVYRGIQCRHRRAGVPKPAGSPVARDPPGDARTVLRPGRCARRAHRTKAPSGVGKTAVALRNGGPLR